jgi:ribulose-5-phosphate 4-epimerase/fuculose-1-phosphate aldolase
MTTTASREGLYIASSDRPIAPAFPSLTPAQELALLARILYREGYNDHLAGHITYRQPDGTFLVNPFGLVWGELQASDVMRMDADGNLLDGKWTITAAIQVHLELHRVREVNVAIHNHPEFGTLWADIGRAPQVYDQTGAFYNGKVAVYSEYEGAVDQVYNARSVVEAMGDADVALLAHHGVLICGDTIPQAYLRAACLEWRCRQAYRVAAAGGGVPMDPQVAWKYGELFPSGEFPGLFEAMARQELRRDPDILS